MQLHTCDPVLAHTPSVPPLPPTRPCGGQGTEWLPGLCRGLEFLGTELAGCVGVSN